MRRREFLGSVLSLPIIGSVGLSNSVGNEDAPPRVLLVTFLQECRPDALILAEVVGPSNWRGALVVVSTKGYSGKFSESARGMVSRSGCSEVYRIVDAQMPRRG